jgi:hypothetical protein
MAGTLLPEPSSPEATCDPPPAQPVRLTTNSTAAAIARRDVPLSDASLDIITELLHQMRHGIKTTRHGTIFAVSRTLDREQHRSIEAVFRLWAIEPYGEDPARLSRHDDRFRRRHRRGRLGRWLHLRLS